jgi:hypothetical protein
MYTTTEVGMLKLLRLLFTVDVSVNCTQKKKQRSKNILRVPYIRAVQKRDAVLNNTGWIKCLHESYPFSSSEKSHNQFKILPTVLLH